MVREVSGGVRGELAIPSVKMEDAGKFTCTASNSYGTEAFVVTLVVQGKIGKISVTLDKTWLGLVKSGQIKMASLELSWDKFWSGDF